MKSDEILKQALEELMEEELSGISSDSIFMPNHSFSKEFDDTIEELQRDNSYKRRRRTFYYKQILSFAASVLLLCSCAFCYYHLFQSGDTASDENVGNAFHSSRNQNKDGDTVANALSENDAEPDETTTFDLASAKQLLYEKEIAQSNVEFSSLSGTSQTEFAVVPEDTSIIVTEDASTNTNTHYIHIDNTEQLVYRVFLQKDLTKLAAASYLQLPKYYYLTDSDIITVTVPDGETAYLFLAYVNAIQISPALLVDLNTQTYAQALYEITPDSPSEFYLSWDYDSINSVKSSDSAIFDIAAWYQEGVTDNAVEEGLAEYSQSAYYSFHVYLTPEEEAKSDLKNNGVIEGVMQLPNSDSSGLTRWYDYTPGRYYLFADIVDSPLDSYFDGYVTITEDGEVDFTLTSWRQWTTLEEPSSQAEEYPTQIAE